MNISKLENEIKAEFNRQALNTYQDISNIRLIVDDLIVFDANGKGFSARLTQTGKLKRNSIRIDQPDICGFCGRDGKADHSGCLQILTTSR